MTRVPPALRSVLAAALAATVVLASMGPAEAQKRGGTLTIVRPTDPVSLDPQLETTAPGAWVYLMAVPAGYGPNVVPEPRSITNTSPGLLGSPTW